MFNELLLQMLSEAQVWWIYIPYYPQILCGTNFRAEQVHDLLWDSNWIVITKILLWFKLKILISRRNTVDFFYLLWYKWLIYCH